MRIRLHQPIEGKAAGEVVDAPEARALWYVANGYAARESAEDSTDGEGELLTPPDADNDPTLADNREKPDEDIPATEEPTTVYATDLGSVQDSSGPPVHLFDPRGKTVKEVQAHLQAHPQDAGRVIGLETSPDGKNRAGVLKAGADFGPQEIPGDVGDPTAADPKVVGPAEPSADTLAGRDAKTPNQPDPGDPATTETPGDATLNEPEPGTVVRNPGTAGEPAPLRS